MALTDFYDADYQPVTVTEVSSATTFWGQSPASKSTLDHILHTLSTAFAANPPLPGAHTPKVNE